MSEGTGKKGKREAPISYRPPEYLRAELLRRVEASGLSVSAFITKAVFDKEPPRTVRKPGVSQQEAGRVLGELGRIAEALRGAAQAATDKDSRAQIDAATRDLSEMRTAVFEALGREP